MEDEKNNEITGAQQQIERLIRLKLEKDKKDKMRMEHAGGHEPTAAPEKKAEIPKQKTAVVKAVSAVAGKKPANSIKVEKRLYEKLHKLVNSLNASGGGRITKAKFVNIIIKEFLALDIDYNVIKNKDEIRKIFGRIKTGN